MMPIPGLAEICPCPLLAEEGELFRQAMRSYAGFANSEGE